MRYLSLILITSVVLQNTAYAWDMPAPVPVSKAVGTSLPEEAPQSPKKNNKKQRIMSGATVAATIVGAIAIVVAGVQAFSSPAAVPKSPINPANSSLGSSKEITRTLNLATHSFVYDNIKGDGGVSIEQFVCSKAPDQALVSQGINQVIAVNTQGGVIFPGVKPSEKTGNSSIDKKLFQSNTRPDKKSSNLPAAEAKGAIQKSSSTAVLGKKPVTTNPDDSGAKKSSKSTAAKNLLDEKKKFLGSVHLFKI